MPSEHKEYQIPLSDVGPIRIETRKRRLIVHPRRRTTVLPTYIEIDAYWDSYLAMVFIQKLPIWENEISAKMLYQAGRNVEEAGHVFAEDEADNTIQIPLKKSHGYHIPVEDIMRRAITAGRSMEVSHGISRTKVNNFLEFFAGQIGIARRLSDQKQLELKAMIYQSKLPIPRRP